MNEGVNLEQVSRTLIWEVSCDSCSATLFTIEADESKTRETINNIVIVGYCSICGNEFLVHKKKRQSIVWDGITKSAGVFLQYVATKVSENAYLTFRRKFFDNYYVGQRLGQAFCNAFDIHNNDELWENKSIKQSELVIYGKYIDM